MKQAIDIDTLDTLVQKARKTLPAKAGARIDKAVELVLAGAVTLNGGSATVKNGKGKTYTIAGGCDCPDYQHGKAPGGWCKHRIAVALAKRLHQTDQQANEQDVAPEGLPEAPASANMRIRIQGVEIMITLRDTDEGRLMHRVQSFLKRYA